MDNARILLIESFWSTFPHLRRWEMEKKARLLKGLTELPGNAPLATPCMRKGIQATPNMRRDGNTMVTPCMRKGILVTPCVRKGSSLSNASWLTDIFFEHWASPVLKKADESILLIVIATFAFMNMQFCFALKIWKHRWVIENLLAVGRHFQKTSYEKEVDGEKQVLKTRLQYPLQIEESTIKLQTQCRLFNWMNTQELKRSCAGKNKVGKKKKPYNFITAFGTYRWRKMSVRSTSSLGPWIFLWSYLAILITGSNFLYSLIVVLFPATLCLEPFPS